MIWFTPTARWKSGASTWQMTHEVMNQCTLFIDCWSQLSLCTTVCTVLKPGSMVVCHCAFAACNIVMSIRRVIICNAQIRWSSLIRWQLADNVAFMLILCQACKLPNQSFGSMQHTAGARAIGWQTSIFILPYDSWYHARTCHWKSCREASPRSGLLQKIILSVEL